MRGLNRKRSLRIMHKRADSGIVCEAIIRYRQNIQSRSLDVFL